jgi:hypothetical protein
MKKFITSILILGIAAFSIMSCEEDVFSSKHNYTEEEIKLRDSLEAVRNNIPADYILTYDIEIPLDTVNYRGVEVPIDTDVLLEKLGFATAEELTAALGTVDGGAQFDHTVTFMAINNSTRFDYTGAFTANGLGYWFDPNGDVINWGDDDALFSELNMETFTFFVGQHPKHLNKGDVHKIIQVMQKDDYRVAFVINVTVGDYYKEEVPNAVNVSTTELTLEVTPNNEYAPTDLPFDFAAAATAMGVSESELSENLTFYGVSSDETMTSTYTADAGYWYTKAGDVTDWGAEGCSVYVNYEDGIFHIGQFPEACQVGDEFTLTVAVMYKTTKMATYKITVKVV